MIPTPETGTLWTIRYHFVDEATGQPAPGATIAVATTRPETILGDTAVAVHPDDPRYRDARRPDASGSRSSSARCRSSPTTSWSASSGPARVKITPAHDHDDYAIGRRHDLPMITVLDDDAAIDGTGTPYDGLDRYEARQRILADLEARGDLVGAKPHEMSIGRCQRSNDVIEPRLKTQWFIRTGPLAERALGGHPERPHPDPSRAVREGLGTLDDEHPRLERLPPALVGPPDPGLVLPGRPHHRVRRGGRSDRRATCAAGRRRS